MASFKDAAITILQERKGPLNCREITRIAIERKLISTTGKSPWDTMSAQLSTDIKKNGGASKFRRLAPGLYGLRDSVPPEPKKPDPKPKPIVETDQPRYIGKAGEHLVASKLLFLGYNASILDVDEGIDIVATKNDKLYNIQVKTSNAKSGRYTADLNVSSYRRFQAGNTFYVFVLRGETEHFVIFPFSEMEKNIALGNAPTINQGKKYRFVFIMKDKQVFLKNLKNSIPFHVDNWDQIA